MHKMRSNHETKISMPSRIKVITRLHLMKASNDRLNIVFLSSFHCMVQLWSSLFWLVKHMQSLASEPIQHRFTRAYEFISNRNTVGQIRMVKTAYQQLTNINHNSTVYMWMTNYPVCNLFYSGKIYKTKHVDILGFNMTGR